VAENSLELRINGLDKLKENLDRFPIEIAKAGLREALAAGGAELLREAKSLAPVDTGALKQSVGMKITQDKGLDTNIVSIGPRYKKKPKDGKKSPGIYGLFVEIGTSKMAPRPWLRPALQAAKDRAVRAFAVKLKTVVDKAAAVLGNR